MSENNIREFPKKSKKTGENLPEQIKHTESYLMQNILYTDQPMKEVDDLINGTKRNRRWGLVLSFAAIPAYDQVPVNQGPTLLPTTPTRFFTADSIEELEARVTYEIKKALRMAKLAVEDPDAFHEETMAAANAFREQQKKEMGLDLESDMS